VANVFDERRHARRRRDTLAAGDQIHRQHIVGFDNAIPDGAIARNNTLPA